MPVYGTYRSPLFGWATAALLRELHSGELLERVSRYPFRQIFRMFSESEHPSLAADLVGGSDGNVPPSPLVQRFRCLLAELAVDLAVPRQKIPKARLRQWGDARLADTFRDAEVRTERGVRVYRQHIKSMVFETYVDYGPRELRYYHRAWLLSGERVFDLESLLSVWGLLGETFWRPQDESEAHRALDALRDCVLLFRSQDWSFVT